jgi:hypothetical protein
MMIENCTLYLPIQKPPLETVFRKGRTDRPTDVTDRILDEFVPDLTRRWQGSWKRFVRDLPKKSDSTRISTTVRTTRCEALKRVRIRCPDGFIPFATEEPFMSGAMP